MQWIQNLRGRLLVLAFLPTLAFTQVSIDATYNPGIASVASPGSNMRMSLPNGGINFLLHFEDEDIAFFAGLHHISRGTGGRIGIYDVNNAFVRFVRSRENFSFAHIPFGMYFKHNTFYVMLGGSIDRYLGYNRKEADVLVSQVPPFEVGTVFGLHIEGGLSQEISDNMTFRSGIYFTNTFAQAPVVPGFLNLGLAIGLQFKMGSEDNYSKPYGEDEDY